MPLIQNQPVIVVQLFAALNIAQRVNENSSFFFSCFAIRFAAMVDPACFVAIGIAVDHFPAFQAEEERVKGVVRVRCFAAVGFALSNALAHVFDDETALRDLARGEDAVAVNLGIANDDR